MNYGDERIIILVKTSQYAAEYRAPILGAGLSEMLAMVQQALVTAGFTYVSGLTAHTKNGDFVSTQEDAI